jgi:hypothetical protein
MSGRVGVTNADRIISLLRVRPGLDDDELAEEIGIRRQTVNQECRLLAAKGIITRGSDGPRGKIVNRLDSADAYAISIKPGKERPPRGSSGRTDEASIRPTGNVQCLKLDGHHFRHVCSIEPRLRPDGLVQEFLPQSRYRNLNSLALNKYGRGPFCKFSVPGNVRDRGVYAITVDGALKYIGECENLSKRYNMGYGNISPRNCFIRGQETNCRINNLIYSASTVRHEIDLWFHRTENHKAVEEQLRASLKPEWNRI